VAMRPPMPSLTLSRRAKVAIWVVVALIVIIVALAQHLSGYRIHVMNPGAGGALDRLKRRLIKNVARDPSLDR